MACLVVTQNTFQKLGIRLMPSVHATLAAGSAPSDFMAFALAVALRFLTPRGDQPRLAEHPPVFVGSARSCADGADGSAVGKRKRGASDGGAGGDGGDGGAFEYVAGLSACPSRGTYEFRDGDGFVPLLLKPLGVEGGCSAAAAASLAGDVLGR